MRDFSKLRLESPPPNKPFLDPYKYKPEETSSSASEDVDVVFKPSYPDIPGTENPNEDEFSHNPSQMEGPKENDGDYENDSSGRYFPHQNSNSPNRPLIGIILVYKFLSINSVAIFINILFPFHIKVDLV